MRYHFKKMHGTPDKMALHQFETEKPGPSRIDPHKTSKQRYRKRPDVLEQERVKRRRRYRAQVEKAEARRIKRRQSRHSAK
jgi:hypothetical protein